jgi:hypothetical protein
MGGTKSHSGEHDGLLELVAAMYGMRDIICTLYIDAKCDDGFQVDLEF